MSTNENTLLLEEAASLIDYWEGSIHAAILESCIEQNDLDNLAEAVRNARHAMLEAEYQAEPKEMELTDTELETLAGKSWTGSTEDVF